MKKKLNSKSEHEQSLEFHQIHPLLPYAYHKVWSPFSKVRIVNNATQILLSVLPFLHGFKS